MSSTIPSAPERAFASGCDLWICSQPNKSAWAQRIDWFLNFQIRRAELHQTREVSGEMRAILEQSEFEAPARDFRNERLMIASAKLLPNRTAVVLPFNGDVQGWAKSCHALWTELGEPTARVFLPEAASLDAFLSSFASARPSTASRPESSVEVVPSMSV